MFSDVIKFVVLDSVCFHRSNRFRLETDKLDFHRLTIVTSPKAAIKIRIMNKRIPCSCFVWRTKLEAHVVGSLPIPQRRKLEEQCETARRRLAKPAPPEPAPALW